MDPAPSDAPMVDAIEEKSAPAVAAPAASPAEPVVKLESDAAAPASSASAAAASAAVPSKGELVAINPKTFWSRLHAVYDSWKKGGKNWGAQPPPGAPASAPATGPAVDSIVLVYGPTSDDNDDYDRVLALHHYLFGYEFSDTVIAFCRDPDTVVIISSAKKCRVLESISKDDKPLPIKLQLHNANKTDKNAANIAAFVKALQKSKSGKRCGTIPEKDARAASSLTTGLQSALKKSGLEIGVDVSAGFASVLAIKDLSARDCISKAADYSTRILKKFLIPQIEAVIDEERKVAQSDLADQTEDAIKDPSKWQVQHSPDDVDSAYSPIIQSGSNGEKFDLKASAQSSNNPLAYDPGTTIIVQLGARYKSYCSNIGRTYFINPVDEQKAVYHVLTDVFVAVKKVMKPGHKISDIMAAAHRAINDAKRPDLISKFTKTCGFGMGLEFREGTMIINDKNSKQLQKGMVFNLCIGFNDLTTKASKATDGQARPYAMLIADTLVITAEDPDSLTRQPREFKDVSYTFGDDAQDAAMKDTDAAAAAAAEADRRSTRGVGKDALRTDMAAEETEQKRAAHQKELSRRKQEEALRRLAAGELSESGKAHAAFDLSTTHVYKTVADMPQVRVSNIKIDAANDCVLFPINDQLVPFHISTILRVYKRDENGFTYLNVKMAVPDTAANRAKMKVHKGMHYVSELTYRTATTSLDKPFFEMDVMRKNWTSRIKDQEVKQSLVAQDELKLDRRGPPPMLKDISVRPHLSRKKTTGTLSSHLNGFRFVTTDKIKVDIIYDNIKSAFYQPAEEGSHNVTIHFELKDPILLDKTKVTKKTSHLQFFVEVVESSEDLSMSSRFRDEDGLAEEQEERRRKKKWNERFLQFVKEVEDKFTKDPSQGKFEFDIPYKELSFSGVPSKQQVTIMPTVHSLVALDDNPPMVVTLAEVEVANFERIQFGLKAFDLVFVWKDFKKLPMRIEAIPVKHLERIKTWLNSCDIVFYESAQNILWKTVMKQINDDIEGFWEDGGFDIFLTHTAEDDGSNDEEEEDEDDDDDAAAGGGGDDAAEGGEGAADGGAKDGKKGKADKKKKKKSRDEESESDFEPSGSSGSDSEEYETPSEEDSDSSDDDDESGAEGGGGSDDEKSLDWDELDEKAKRDDKAKAAKIRAKAGSDVEVSSGDDSDEDRRPKKKAHKQSTMTGSKSGSSKPSSGSSKPSSGSSKPGSGKPSSGAARPASSIRK